jgi:hypothetical protein
LNHVILLISGTVSHRFGWLCGTSCERSFRIYGM